MRTHSRSLFITLALIQVGFMAVALVAVSVLTATFQESLGTVLTISYLMLSCVFPAGLLILPIFLGKEVKGESEKPQ